MTSANEYRAKIEHTGNGWTYEIQVKGRNGMWYTWTTYAAEALKLYAYPLGLPEPPFSRFWTERDARDASQHRMAEIRKYMENPRQIDEMFEYEKRDAG